MNKCNRFNIKEDLYQVGVIGLINAYKNYDYNYGTKFSTYAYPYIFGEMKKYLHHNIGIKISRDLVYLSSRIEKVKNIIAQKLNREPTIKEIAKTLNIDENKIEEALQLNFNFQSLDTPLNAEGKEITLMEVVSKDRTVDKLDLIFLKEELLKLSEKEKKLVGARCLYGKTQNETATMLGISQVQVSREEQKVLTKLKSKLER